MIVLSLCLCLAKLVELVGLGCAVLVVASLCSAWRPPPPASMKAAAWPAAAFLHSRAAAQLPPQLSPQLPPQLCCTTTTTTPSTQELPNCTAADNRDHNCRSCHRRICIQPNTTTQLMEPISCTQQDYTHHNFRSWWWTHAATTHTTEKNRTPTTPQPMEARTAQATTVYNKVENKWM